ncbi:MAG: PASTA domain-containing protein [Flavobacteriales bacterium]
MFKFLLSKSFVQQLAIAVFVVVLTIISTYYYLKNYARTGEAIEVPDLTGYDIIEAEGLLKQSDLVAEVIDSLFIEGKRGGEIVDQEPRGTSLVKSGRKIYLTVTRYIVPQTKLPNVINQGLPLAQAKLTSYGFKIGKLIPRPDPCTNCAIGFEVKGKPVKVGSNLPKGVTIDIVVGQKEDGAVVSVPILYGLTLDEAKEMLLNHSLNLGATVIHDAVSKEDSTASLVYWQSNNQNEHIPMGSSVNVYLSSDHSKVPEVNSDSLKALLK